MKQAQTYTMSAHDLKKPMMKNRGSRMTSTLHEDGQEMIKLGTALRAEAIASTLHEDGQETIKLETAMRTETIAAGHEHVELGWGQAVQGEKWYRPTVVGRTANRSVKQFKKQFFAVLF